jgi:hypothetical protein
MDNILLPMLYSVHVLQPRVATLIRKVAETIDTGALLR